MGDFNPTLAARLCEEIEEDDRRMTRAPWTAKGFGFGVGFCHGFQDGSEDKLDSGRANTSRSIPVAGRPASVTERSGRRS